MIESLQQFQVGDVISVKGPSVPRGYERAYFRVLAVTTDAVSLSRPYADVACTQPFRADVHVSRLIKTVTLVAVANPAAMRAAVEATPMDDWQREDEHDLVRLGSDFQ